MKETQEKLDRERAEAEERNAKNLKARSASKEKSLQLRAARNGTIRKRKTVFTGFV